jgi:hypothetical protein
MNKLFSALVLFFFANVSLQAQELQHPPSAQGSASALEAGTYLLVYQLGEGGPMRHLTVSFAKGTDGSIILSSPDAPSSPVSVVQSGPIFQFTIVRPGFWDKTRGIGHLYEGLIFVGRPDVEKAAGVFTGTAAGITSDPHPSGGSNPASSGTFLLYKLP